VIPLWQADHKIGYEISGRDNRFAHIRGGSMWQRQPHLETLARGHAWAG
jgi:hypothetical protein